MAFEDWRLMDDSGQAVNFESLAGEVVLLNFWATWCPPCIAEMPALDALYREYGDRVTFVLVSNESPEVVRKFMERKNYVLPSFTPLSVPPDQLQIRSIPRTFLIDREGQIVIDKTGAANWNGTKVRNQLDALLSR